MFVDLTLGMLRIRVRSKVLFEEEGLSRSQPMEDVGILPWCF